MRLSRAGLFVSGLLLVSGLGACASNPANDIAANQKSKNVDALTAAVDDIKNCLPPDCETYSIKWRALNSAINNPQNPSHPVETVSVNKSEPVTLKFFVGRSITNISKPGRMEPVGEFTLTTASGHAAPFESKKTIAFTGLEEALNNKNGSVSYKAVPLKTSVGLLGSITPYVDAKGKVTVKYVVVYTKLDKLITEKHNGLQYQMPLISVPIHIIGHVVVPAVPAGVTPPQIRIDDAKSDYIVLLAATVGNKH